MKKQIIFLAVQYKFFPVFGHQSPVSVSGSALKPMLIRNITGIRGFIDNYSFHHWLLFCGSGSGIRCLFDPWPGSSIRVPGGVKNQDPGSGINNPDNISESLETTFFWDKIRYFDSDPGRKKFGSGFLALRCVSEGEGGGGSGRSGQQEVLAARQGQESQAREGGRTDWNP